MAELRSRAARRASSRERDGGLKYRRIAASKPAGAHTHTHTQVFDRALRVQPLPYGLIGTVGVRSVIGRFSRVTSRTSSCTSLRTSKRLNRLQEHHGVDRDVVVVLQRVRDGFADVRDGGEVYDRVHGVLAERAVDVGLDAQVAVAGRRRGGGGGEIAEDVDRTGFPRLSIHDRHRVPLVQQTHRRVRTDETRAAGHEDVPGERPAAGGRASASVSSRRSSSTSTGTR